MVDPTQHAAFPGFSRLAHRLARPLLAANDRANDRANGRARGAADGGDAQSGPRQTPPGGSERPRLPRPSDDDNGGSGLPSNLILWVTALSLLALWGYSIFGFEMAGGELSYSRFRQEVKDGNVERVRIEGKKITGNFRTPVMRSVGDGDSTRAETFRTYAPEVSEALVQDLRDANAEVIVRPESDFPWSLIILGLLPVFLILGVGYLFLRRMQSQGQGLFSVRKSKAKLYDKEDEQTTFEDVAGQEGAKEELEEIIEYLKEPGRFSNLGGKVPKGVLLVGPPGTGKTLMARAVAGEAEVPFYSVSGSDFMEMFVGVGASRVRDMFEEAKKNSPAIIFVDELDSIGRQRGAGLGGGHDEREQTLNQLLSELDGFEKNESVVVMAATNRPDILDSALTRPGRFDRQITVDLPMQKARVAILEIHARNKPLADDVDLERVAQNTPGFSGADLENLLNEAALLAGREGAEEITGEHIDEARDKVIMGLKRKGMVLTDDMKRLLAYHEGGHAINAAALEHADPIHKVTIVPRGKAMGVTQQLPEEEKYLYRREYVLDRLAVIMGGRAAEELIFDTATSGAENDLKQVRQMARKMVLDWGMGENFRHVALGEDQGNVFLGEELAKGRNYSDATAREVDQEVRRITEEAFERAKNTLEANRDALDRLADLLIEDEEVPGEKVVALLGHAAEGNEVLTDDAPEDAQADEDAGDASGEAADESTDAKSTDAEPHDGDGLPAHARNGASHDAASAKDNASAKEDEPEAEDAEEAR